MNNLACKWQEDLQSQLESFGNINEIFHQQMKKLVYRHMDLQLYLTFIGLNDQLTVVWVYYEDLHV